MTELNKGDRVRHETLGEGRIDDISDCEVYGTALVMFKDGEFGSHAAWVALDCLSKVEPTSDLLKEAVELVRLMSEAFEQPDVHYMRKCLGYDHFEQARSLIDRLAVAPPLERVEDSERVKAVLDQWALNGHPAERRPEVEAAILELIKEDKGQ